MQLKISDRIKKYRSEKNLTQEEVASALGISYQAISKWERNDGYLCAVYSIFKERRGLSFCPLYWVAEKIVKN